MPEVVELRCPVGFRRLFSRMKLGQEIARHVAQGNLLEFTCSDCAKQLVRERGTPVRVCHQFNFLGELVATTVDPLA